MPGQALDDTTLASNSFDPLSRLTCSGSEVSTVPPIQGTKRKASNIENVAQSPSQSYPPIKAEPGSPSRLHYRADIIREARPELHGKPTRYEGSSSSDDTEEQIPLQNQNNHGECNGAASHLPILDKAPPPCRQQATGRTGNARPSTGSRFEDVDYKSIPDYSPPLSTLPRGEPHLLQVNWRNWRKTPFGDLSNDPDRDMLHEAELQLATTLNLSCAKYLCTKRRIFRGRLKALQAGKEFKKADSQKVCRIDAGRASKMCGVFEEIGWFDKKYFLRYLTESHNPVGKASNENKHIGSPSLGLNNPNIWDVSESEVSLTSDRDDESTDDDTADSSVSSDRRYDQSERRRTLNSYQGTSWLQQNRGLSLTGRNDGQRRELIDGTVQIHRNRSRDEAVDADPFVEQRTSRSGSLSKEKVDSRTSERLSGGDAKEVPGLETIRMTPKIRLAFNSHSRDRPNAVSTIKTKSSQQESNLNKLHRPVAVPHSLDEANAADTMLVKMKAKGCMWREIEEAWAKKTGKAQSRGALSGRWSRIMANLASTGLQPYKEPNNDYTFTEPRLDSDDVSDHDSINRHESCTLNQDQRLLTAEAEVEEKFQCEKANIIAEMESNYQSEKWNLVAEAMSRTGSVHFSAGLVQAQYEKLTRDPEKSDAKEEERHDTIDLPRRTNRTTKRRRANEASNVSQPQHARLFLYQKRPDRGQAITSTSGQKSSADGVRHREAPKDREQLRAEQSARSLRVWAKRRALGTHGRDGCGPPKAIKAKTAVPNAAPKPRIPLAPTVTYQSEVRGDANQHKQSLSQIIPTAPQTGNGQKRVKTYKKHVGKRNTCGSCGLSYRHDSEHYRVFPNIGSEHRRTLAANKAAAESHSGPSITDVGVKDITDLSMVQMIFETPSKE